jgi:ubiquinone/menaquinone biosynthesis C-methylase UbiE
MDAKNLDFDNNIFDYVICMLTFVNFEENKKKILGEMKRVLKKEGEIILSVYHENAFNERIKIYKKIGTPIEKVVKTKVFFKKPFGVNSEQFSLKELKEIFYETRLKVIEIKKKGIGYLCRLKK